MIRKEFIITSFITLVLIISCKSDSSGKFQKYLGISPGTDVKKIMYYDNGHIDAEHFLSFECSASTIESIINKLNLTEDFEKYRGGYATRQAQCQTAPASDV